MTSVNSTATNNQVVIPGRVAKGAQTATDKANSHQGVSRALAEKMAGVGGKAFEIGKDVAQKGVNAIADQALTGAEHTARHAVRASVLNPMSTLYSSMVTFLPFGVGKNLFSGVLSKFFLPYYQQINPATKITSEEIIHALEHGHTDSLENELFEAFNKFVNSNLKDDERAKYESGDKLVVIKAFKNLTMSQINTAREPGGIAKICGGIANFIPLVNKLPATIKPWVGGAIGGYVALRVVKFAWKMLKWGIAMFAGVTGLKFLASKFGGGGAAPGMGSMSAMHGEEPAVEGGGMMSKIMNGVNKAAQMAAQAQGGGGHGAPGGGGALSALAALAGGAGGH
jgi:hypothetical protein